MKVRFVVDSASDVPQHYVERYGMYVIPLYVNYGGNSYADNGQDLNRLDYYELLKTINPIPQTSAPSVGVAGEALLAALQGYDHLFIVTISSKLSGTYNALRLAAEQQLKPEQYTMVDSSQLSTGSGWLAILGAETAEATHGDISKIRHAIERVKQHTEVYAAMTTVEFLRKGGRISWGQATVGGLLKIRPIVQLQNGLIESVARARTEKKWLEQLEAFVRQHNPIERIVFLYALDPTPKDELKKRLADILPPIVEEVIVTPSIGTHTGPDAIGVAIVRKGWKDA